MPRRLLRLTMVSRRSLRRAITFLHPAGAPRGARATGGPGGVREREGGGMARPEREVRPRAPGGGGGEGGGVGPRGPAGGGGQPLPAARAGRRRPGRHVGGDGRGGVG